MLFQRFLFEVSATLKQKLSSKVFCKKDVPKKFAKFTGKHLYISIILNKVSGLQPVTSLNQRLRYRYFPVNFTKFLIAPVLQHICERELLKQGFVHILKIIQCKTKHTTNSTYLSEIAIIFFLLCQPVRFDINLLLNWKMIIFVSQFILEQQKRGYLCYLFSLLFRISFSICW